MSTTTFAECGSPKTEEDFRALGDAMYEWAQKEEGTEGWIDLAAGITDVTMHDKNPPLALGNEVKSETVMPFPAGTVVAGFIDNTLKYEDDLISSLVVKDFGDNAIVAMYRYKTPWPTTSREFVIYRCIRSKEAKTYIVGGSINTDLVGVDANYVRGVSKLAIIVEPIDASSCKVTRIAFVDPKGMIPTWVINLKKSADGMRLVAFKAALAARAPK